MTSSTKHFIRHYLEMVAAMIAGMVVLGLPAEAAMQAMGYGSAELQADAPAVALLGMGFMMTVPMVGWMAHRGHGARANAEMAASMVLPTLGVVALLGMGAVTDFGRLMTIEHAVMLPSMLVAMLMRAGEYTGHGRPAARAA